MSRRGDKSLPPTRGSLGLEAIFRILTWNEAIYPFDLTVIYARSGKRLFIGRYRLYSMARMTYFPGRLGKGQCRIEIQRRQPGRVTLAQMMGAQSGSARRCVASRPTQPNTERRRSATGLFPTNCPDAVTACFLRTQCYASICLDFTATLSVQSTGKSKMQHLSSGAVVARNDGLLEAEIDNEVVALAIERGTCYGLNRVGSRIWNLLATPMRIGDLCQTLLSEYKVDPNVCERQVLDLLEELQAEGLIVTIEEK
jgi:Coenzyme PQQ synthesis protein D (PqqD)